LRGRTHASISIQQGIAEATTHSASESSDKELRSLADDTTIARGVSRKKRNPINYL
jgi:hypothetical protein